MVRPKADQLVLFAIRHREKNMVWVIVRGKFQVHRMPSTKIDQLERMITYTRFAGPDFVKKYPRDAKAESEWGKKDGTTTAGMGVASTPRTNRSPRRKVRIVRNKRNRKKSTRNRSPRR